MQFSSHILAAAAVGSLAMAKVFFEERFDKDAFEPTWVYPSKNPKAAELGKFRLNSGKFYADEKANKGLQTSEDNKFYAISAKLNEPFDNKDQPFVFQYSVKHEQIIDCGGAYVKLLGKGADQAAFNADSQYEIMFGPDICGNMRKLMFLFTKDGKNHMWKKNVLVPADDLTHVYTFVLNTDNSYEVYIDGEQRAKGDLVDDWDMVAPRQIPDTEAKKPENWVEQRDMEDPEDKKPENWVEGLPQRIPDPEAKKPEDWDDDTDGKWEAPLIDNPDYRPAWKPRRIPNPEYKGPWKAPMIPNPEFKEAPELYKFAEPISFVAIEIWQVKSGTIFDNFLITNNAKEAEKVAVETYEQLKEAETKARDTFREAQMASAKAKAAELEAQAEAEDEARGEEENTKEEAQNDKASKKEESNKKKGADSHKHEL